MPEDGRNGVNWIQLLTVVFLLLILLIYMGLEISKQKNRAELTEASSNAKSLYYLLIEFEQDYGEFPSDATAVEELAGLRSDHYSNEYFTQLIVGGYTVSEEIFKAKGGASRNVSADNAKPYLEAGECGFAYVEGSSAADTPETPLVMAPMDRSGIQFIPGLYLRKAVVLNIDGSINFYALDSENRAITGAGKTLFEGGKGTVWGEGGFDVNRLKHAK